MLLYPCGHSYKMVAMMSWGKEAWSSIGRVWTLQQDFCPWFPNFVKGHRHTLASLLSLYWLMCLTLEQKVSVLREGKMWEKKRVGLCSNLRNRDSKPLTGHPLLAQDTKIHMLWYIYFDFYLLYCASQLRSSLQPRDLLLIKMHTQN